jgi:membrane protein implicated in regulation of membrane protease activity
MTAKGMLYYVLGAAAIIFALYFFFKWLDWKFLLPLALGIAAALLFRQGVVESKKQKS